MCYIKKKKSSHGAHGVHKETQRKIKEYYYCELYYKELSMKKFYVALSCIVLLLVLGCTSTKVVTDTSPFVYTNNESTKLVILGEVRLESSDRKGYNDLLKAARSLYPDCDYVIDIMIDKKTVTTTKTTVFFFLRRQSVDTVNTYTMRGTAIKYVR